MNLPIELVDKILQYDGRIKYRKGEFINLIHPRDLDFYRFVLNPLIEKKINIHTTGICSIHPKTNIRTSSIPDNTGFNFGPTWNFYTKDMFLREGTMNKFYFEFEFLIALIDVISPSPIAVPSFSLFTIFISFFSLINVL